MFSFLDLIGLTWKYAIIVKRCFHFVFRNVIYRNIEAFKNNVEPDFKVNTACPNAVPLLV